ncbi:Rieske 2Fe-2S domain-containing protein [Cystobacter ferrugineus]|uniref:Rieske domain-containing protein n=1 Tax=Cystobacter ferrugineus TaxID=83449 RepID=A0A1L9B8L3_9BACT|nr:Rieske 2Fe-2S domain-containing protein [Cystobacter ferrugineus]OJH38584.1 hypothetical protein BON30_20285 [Cystobacter ferrugineus]
MIVRFEARHWERVRVGGEHYLCLKQGEGLVVIHERCRHRGGPLGLGTWNEKTQCVVCPWHELENTPRDMARRQVPSVRVGQSMTIVVPEPA